ncbi:MAG: hypothetical protein LBF85_02215 [Tannerella sp.]|nr:hypothetical protein [Tannerella sp.]
MVEAATRVMKTVKCIMETVTRVIAAATRVIFSSIDPEKSIVYTARGLKL